MALVGRRVEWEEIDLAVYQKEKIDRDYYSNKELSANPFLKRKGDKPLSKLFIKNSKVTTAAYLNNELLPFESWIQERVLRKEKPNHLLQQRMKKVIITARLAPATVINLLKFWGSCQTNKHRGSNKDNGMVIEEVIVIKKEVQITIVKKIRKIIDWNGVVVQGNGVLMEMIRRGNGGIMRAWSPARMRRWEGFAKDWSGRVVVITVMIMKMGSGNAKRDGKGRQEIADDCSEEEDGCN
ncbi:hypothetical protein KIL84_015293 [Mauremys mutica]|uniref:Uncharacterized protein n=1 Tax=Mauremys mutica TaxID=74926 RepID=A0A9D3WSG1_9SAUR|nr:hypothetical protein KIL84_015293 [Mauremys mutica]